MSLRRWTLSLGVAAVIAVAGCGSEPNSAPMTADAGTDAANVAVSGRVSAQGGVAAQLDPGHFLPLTVRHRHIVDADGRRVILRGLEHHALQDVDYQGRQVEAGDYADIASWGFTTLRVAISWSKIEPERGHYDAQYLDKIGDVLDRANKAGLTVILEWHQDLWGRCSQAPGTALRSAANGAPDWTCPTDYQPSALGHWELFDRLWANEDGLLDAFIEAWGQVIDRFGDHPALLGYDVINEPQGTGSHVGRDKIFPAFRDIVPRLRQRGATGLMFMDAPIQRNDTLTMDTEPLGDIDPELVFAPHLYSGWLKLYVVHQRVTDDHKRRDFAKAAEQAAALGLPLWNGEWGVNLNLDGAVDDLQTHVQLEDKYMVGSSYWSFSQAGSDTGQDNNDGAQALLNADRSVRADVLDKLSRPYPIQTPGDLDSLNYEFDTHTLHVSLSIGEPTDAALVLYAPARHLGDDVCLSVDGPGRFDFDGSRADERVLVRFGQAGHFDVTLRPCGTAVPGAK